jgi:hypothetical protein
MSDESRPFFENPILNSPYEEPARHHALEALDQLVGELAAFLLPPLTGSVAYQSSPVSGPSSVR